MSALSISEVRSPKPGWYLGDFHAHTTFSDGRYTPVELAGLARERGLDFFAITDHNSIGSYTEFGEDPGLLVIPGIEITLDIGHWNVFGMEGWRDWMEGICSDQISITLPDKYGSATEVMQQIASQGLPNSINHPLLKPWEWREGGTQLRYVDYLEIWNDPLWPDNGTANPQAVEFWTACLNAGYRITAIGGSDFHFMPGDDPVYPGELMALPGTYVYAEELSGSGILAGIKQHRAYVSMGPRVSFTGQVNGTAYGVGADLGSAGGEIDLSASVSEVSEGVTVKIIKNGLPVAESVLHSAAGPVRFSERLDPSSAGWYRMDVFNQEGQMIAVTNPIFTGVQPPPVLETFLDVFINQEPLIHGGEVTKIEA